MVAQDVAPKKKLNKFSFTKKEPKGSFFIGQKYDYI